MGTLKQQEIVELNDKIAEFNTKIEVLDKEILERQKFFENEIKNKGECEEKLREKISDLQTMVSTVQEEGSSLTSKIVELEKEKKENLENFEKEKQDFDV